jgi:hypothetical protein
VTQTLAILRRKDCAFFSVGVKKAAENLLLKERY